MRSLADPYQDGTVVQAFLLGEIEYDRCLALQQKLVDDAHSRADRRIVLLLCEHPPVITIGRSGSREDVQLRSVQLAGRPIDVRSAQRGGGAVLHLPGQLAVYPIVPLERLGWSVGEFLSRFQAGLLASLAELQVQGQAKPEQYGIWGNSGQLASLGVGIKHWITHFGAQINVLPPLHLFQYVVTDPISHSTAGSLASELGCSPRMANVRSRVVRGVSEALGCEKYHLYTSHPLLERIGRHPFARAS